MAAVRSRSIEHEIVATIALATFSGVVAAGFARVFSGWGFLDNLLLIVIAGHGLSLVLRVVRVPVWAALPAIVASMIWLIGAIYYRETYSLLLPTSDTWTLFRLELDVVSEQFRTAVAPVAFLGGWDVLASIGVAVVVVLSDAFAFRAYARAESLVPGGVLFVFVAALGNDRLRVPLTIALVAAGVLATAILRVYHAPERGATIGRRRHALRVGVPAALASAIAIAVVAGFVGPRIPGADAEAIYDTKGRDGGSVTEVLSPLVDIRSRLTNRQTTELFVVDANEPSYWRSSALPRFDGRTWGLPERGLTRTDGPLSDTPVGATEIRQRLFVAALGGKLVPAAADPIAASGSDELRWNADSATLVKTGEELIRGDTFEIVSASPRYSPEQLAAATSTDPGDPIYFELPDDFPDSVAVTTREVTAGATSTYDAALRLQNWFRSEFRYSLEIQEGHSTSAIEAFLRDRVGYCEQFAGTYAAMLRTIGIPARVAVGFTPGIDDGTGSYSVQGRNAHAWPEVWFDGFGWVPFEPTPGRGAPGAESYTGVPAEQDDGPVDEAGESDGTADESGEAAPATTTPPTTLPGSPASTLPGAESQVPVVPPTAEDESTGSDGSFPLRGLLIVTLIVVALLAPAVIRRVRRRTTGSPLDDLDAYWDRSLAAVREVGVAPSGDQTPVEAAQATAEEFPIAARPMQSLADVVTEATYSHEGVAVLTREGTYGTTTLGNCSVWCRQVEKAVTDSIGPRDRVRRYFTSLR